MTWKNHVDKQIEELFQKSDQHKKEIASVSKQIKKLNKRLDCVDLQLLTMSTGVKER
jgi:peptidoglycan hydrolase CwlO-like protein